MVHMDGISSRCRCLQQWSMHVPSYHQCELYFAPTNQKAPSTSFVLNGFPDSTGAFNIEMTLGDATVKGELLKRYHDPEVMNLPFQGVITPFGIVGTFGNGERGSTRQAHWLWLWRSEWVPAQWTRTPHCSSLFFWPFGLLETLYLPRLSLFLGESCQSFIPFVYLPLLVKSFFENYTKEPH